MKYKIMCLNSKSYGDLIVPLLLVAAFLMAGCARDRNLVNGTVKEISGQGTMVPLQKPGEVKASASEEGSSIVELETVTIPPLKETPPPADYIVGPNDTILVTVSGHSEFSPGIGPFGTGTQHSSRVDGSGYIQMPIIGLVKVSGLTLPQIKRHIENLLVKYVKTPSVVVDMIDYKSHPLYLLGEFKMSGVFYMDRPFNVLQGLALGGGYDLNSANPKAARVIRDKRVLPVDVYELLMKADQTQNVWLKSGDTIFMPDNKNMMVFVFGSGKAGISIPIPLKGLNLLQAIAIAGFQEIGYHSRRVFLIRSLSPTRGQLMVIDVDKIIQGEALPLKLSEGDVIYIPKSSMTTFNEAISEMLPTLQAFGAILQPFIQLKYLFPSNSN